MELTKTEVRDLKKHKYDPGNILPPNGQEITHLIVVSHGNKKVHDSGYPFIKILGVGKDNNLINLGWHDHFLSYVPINIDSLGKNIFRVMKWYTKQRWKIMENFISCSTFQIGNVSGWSKMLKDEILLQ